MRKYFHITFFFFLAVFFNSCQDKVDLIVHNATVYSLGDIRGKVTAFVVDKGKFVAVGGDELIDNYDAKKVLDLQKLPVYPAFIDSHCHFLKLGLSLQQLDLRGTRSFEEVLIRVQGYSKNKKLKAIIGRGWDQNDWKDKSLTNKSKLDSLFPDIPVALRRIDGHALLVNQKALDMAGINEKTKIEGGTIIKNNGRLSGVLVDSPISLVTSILPKPSLNEQIKALKDAEKIAFKMVLQQFL